MTLQLTEEARATMRAALERLTPEERANRSAIRMLARQALRDECRTRIVTVEHSQQRRAGAR